MATSADRDLFNAIDALMAADQHEINVASSSVRGLNNFGMADVIAAANTNMALDPEQKEEDQAQRRPHDDASMTRADEKVSASIDFGAILTAGLDLSDDADAELFGLLSRRGGKRASPNADNTNAPSTMASQIAACPSSSPSSCPKATATTSDASTRFFQSMCPNLSADEIRSLQEGTQVAVGSVATVRAHNQKEEAPSSRDGVDDIDTDEELVDVEATWSPAAGGATTSSPSGASLATRLASSHVDPETAVLLAGLEDEAYRRGARIIADADKKITANTSNAAAPVLNNLFSAPKEANNSTADGGVVRAEDEEEELSDAVLASMMTGIKTEATKGQSEQVVAASPLNRPRPTVIKRNGVSAANDRRLLSNLPSEDNKKERAEPNKNEPTDVITPKASCCDAQEATCNCDALSDNGLLVDDGDKKEDELLMANLFSLPDDSIPHSLQRRARTPSIAPGALAANSDLLVPPSVTEVEGLRDLVETVDDGVMPMALDPEFDYDKHINGFTSRLGELIRKEEASSNKQKKGDDPCPSVSPSCSLIPDDIRKAAKKHDDFLASSVGGKNNDDKTASGAADREMPFVANDSAAARGKFAGNRFASLFLNQDDPFEKRAESSSSTAAAVVGTTAFSSKVPDFLHEQTQLVGGMGDDRCDDVSVPDNKAEKAQRSLLGCVVDDDGGNGDDTRIVDMVMKWAQAQNA